MAESNEQVIFEDGNVKITNLRAILDGKTYSVSNITSVGMTRQDPTGCFVPGLIIFGILIIFLNMVGGDNGPNWGLVVTGAFMAGLGFLAARGQKASFIVQVGSASGEVKALTTQDKALAEKVVGALNDAIVKKG